MMLAAKGNGHTCTCEREREKTERRRVGDGVADPAYGRGGERDSKIEKEEKEESGLGHSQEGWIGRCATRSVQGTATPVQSTLLLFFLSMPHAWLTHEDVRSS